MTYFIFTLGCQMNVSDSEKIELVLDKLGFQKTSEHEADLIVVNACSIRQSAVDRIYGKLKVWQGKKVIITGCLLLKDKQKLIKRVDLIFNIQDLGKLPKALGQKKNIHEKNYLKIKSKIKNKQEILIPIMTGCNQFCSYCAVPYVRGREISRSEKDILNDFQKAVNNGAQKIILLGQNVNKYKPSFVQLLKKLIKIPGDFKIQFLSANPWDFPDELIDLIALEPKMSTEIHLPVQSGDDEILKKMNRPYTAAQYLALISKLKSQISQPKAGPPLAENLYLSTDIIVGFPGETKKAFQNTAKLCQTVKFNKAYIAQYSSRSSTLSAQKYSDNVPRLEKKRRWQALENLINH